MTTLVQGGLIGAIATIYNPKKEARLSMSKAMPCAAAGMGITVGTLAGLSVRQHVSLKDLVPSDWVKVKKVA
jgi:hypothetical protein